MSHFAAALQRLRRRVAGCAAPLLAMAASACVSLAPEAEVPPPVAALPAEYGLLPDETPYLPAGWWTEFDDPALTSLIGQAALANPELAAAAARADEARANARAAGAALLPGVVAGADVSYSDTPLTGGGLGGLLLGGGGTPGEGDLPDGELPDGELPDGELPGDELPGNSPDPGGDETIRITTETFALSLGVSYDPDLFGRLRGEARAARDEALAAVADVIAVRHRTVSEVARAYFNLVDARRSILLTLESIDILADRLERADERYRSGLISSFELYQVRQDYQAAQANLPQLEARETQLTQQLAALTGNYRPPAVLQTPLRPRLVFEPVPAGAPAALLVQRPEIAAAALRYEAARHVVGARRADLLPQLSLGGSIGTQADDPLGAFDILDNWALNLTAGLTAPLFQGGLIRARIDAAEARYRAAAANYAQTVLGAWQEVTSAAEDYQEQRQRYAFLAAQLQEAQASSQLQAERFAAGVGDLSGFLDAERNRLQVAQALSQAARDTALARISIYRALGGNWEVSGAVPVRLAAAAGAQ